MQFYIYESQTFKEVNGHYYRTSRNYKYWAENIFPESSKSREELICKPSINRIKKTISKFEKLENLNALEIGALDYYFCFTLYKEKVFSSYEVIEPTPPLAEHCQNLGILVHKTTIEDFKSTKKNIKSFAPLRLLNIYIIHQK